MRDYFLRAAHMLVNTDEGHTRAHLPLRSLPSSDARRRISRRGTAYGSMGPVTQPTAEPRP